MDRYERLERIDYKSARDVVTEADHLSEALILEAIRARFPDDAILAEETGEHRAIAGEAPTSGRGRVWIVDPLDGTVNYANGIPMFCVSIGLVVDGVPVVGVVLDPTRDEAFSAAADGPAFAQRAPVPCLGQGQAVRLRDLDVAQRPDRRQPCPQRAQGDPHLALDGLGRAGAGIRRERPVRRLRPAGRAVGLGRRGRRSHRRAGRGDGHRDGRRPVVRPRPLARSRSGSSPRRRPTTRRSSDSSARCPPPASDGASPRAAAGPIPRRRLPTRPAARRPSAARRGRSGGWARRRRRS